MTYFAFSSTPSRQPEKIRVLAGDLTRHRLWVPYIIETRGPFPEWKGLFFRDRVVGGDG